MKAAQAVRHLREVLNGLAPPYSEDDVYASMEQAGVHLPETDRAFKMSQLVCGRIPLRDMGIAFSDEYTFFDANGEVAEAGSLESDAYFAAAKELAKAGCFDGASFAHFAMMSAEVQAVNEALNAGSRPEDLIMSPAFMFSEPPTRVGMERAQRTIRQQMSRTLEPPASERPWWKFW